VKREQATILLARRVPTIKGSGRAPTLVLCSRNARPEKGLVRRPHLDQRGCPSMRGKSSELGRINEMDDSRSMRAVKDGLPAPYGIGEESEEPCRSCFSLAKTLSFSCNREHWLWRSSSETGFILTWATLERHCVSSSRLSLSSIVPCWRLGKRHSTLWHPDEVWRGPPPR
jgi:hypothetical protein